VITGGASGSGGVAAGSEGGGGTVSGGATRNSSWRAPHDGQKRARALMRSPQLGQKIVSLKVFPLASVGGNGYHLRPMDARAWTVRLDVGVGDYLEGLDHLDIQSPLREPLWEEFDWGAAFADLEGDPALAIALVAVLPLLGGLGLGALASRLLVHP
jgi:hypothetical protein